MSSTIVITRNVSYELRIPVELVAQIPLTVELQDMEIVNDSGVQILVETSQEKA